MLRIQDYLLVKDNIPIDIEYGSILDIVTNRVTANTHGFHKYPAKFIPQIPKWAIEKYLSPNQTGIILDPFCGSGTTLVEGLLAGHNVIGMDVDPLSVLITKAKITPIKDIPQLLIIYDWIASEIKERNRKGIFKPACNNLAHWFSSDSIQKLSFVRTLIDEIPERFGGNQNILDIVDLMIVCFSSIIRRVSNADNESQKTYVSHTKTKEPEETISVFLAQLNYFTNRIIEYTKLVNKDLNRKIIRSSSSEELETKLLGGDIDLVITSPPYIKAIDYIYNQMVELFWIGDLFSVDTQSKQNETKKYYIGNKHFSKQTYINYSPYINTLNIPELDKKIFDVFDTDDKNGHKHAFIAYKYFTDMEKHFCEISKCLKRNTHYVMVVGNSSISDILFSTDEYLIKIAERNGFMIANKWGYNIKNRFMRFDRKGRGGIIEIDRVLDFIKN